MVEIARLDLQQMAGALGDLLDHPLGRRQGDPRPLAMGDGDDAVPLQRLQRLAHGRSADAVELHELAFARQLVARLELAGAQAFEQTLQHFLEELATLDGCDGGHGMMSSSSQLG